MAVYRTQDGDVLDAICLAELGSEAHVHEVLEANPGLAARGPIYPAGIDILLPTISAEPVRTGEVRLWGKT